MKWLERLWRLLPDNCEVCHGRKGGVRGNENVITLIDGNKMIMCDYCSEPWSHKTLDEIVESDLDHWLMHREPKDKK